MQRAKDLALVAVTALLTALVAGPLLAPSPAGAVDEDAAPLAPVATPVLQAGDVRLRLTLERDAYAVGESPVAVLEAANAGSEDARAELQVRLMRRPDVRAEVRMPPMPLPVWTQPLDISVGAGGTRTLRLPTDTKLVEGFYGYFEIVAGDRVVHAAEVRVPATALQVPVELDVPAPATVEQPVAAPADEALAPPDGE